MDGLDQGSQPESLARYIKPLGRYGIASRAFVQLVIEVLKSDVSLSLALWRVVEDNHGYVCGESSSANLDPFHCGKESRSILGTLPGDFMGAENSMPVIMLHGKDKSFWIIAIF
ncbi:hypothetical protein GX50_07787 [[Emmonsia] crescens]|uniref:Uncharacterized protein n=1 Tax=[Emmonsia] crescens TaxID=73230 RepID=A0A2B7Z8W7_9EURO|nr:hypothetical protein GX50_07787 [Emmonsia crescens]